MISISYSHNESGGTGSVEPAALRNQGVLETTGLTAITNTNVPSGQTWLFRDNDTGHMYSKTGSDTPLRLDNSDLNPGTVGPILRREWVATQFHAAGASLRVYTNTNPGFDMSGDLIESLGATAADFVNNNGIVIERNGQTQDKAENSGGDGQQVYWTTDVTFSFNQDIYAGDRIVLTYMDTELEQQDLVVEAFILHFNATTDWIPDVGANIEMITVTAQSHGKGIDPVVTVYDENDDEVQIGINNDGAGNIILSVDRVPDNRFVGRAEFI